MNASRRQAGHQERQLIRRGLLPGPRATEGAPRRPWLALREVLEEFGSVYTAFARFLAQRADLLPIEACLELAEAAFTPQPLVGDELVERISSELGQPLAEALPAFEDRPCAVGLFTQDHRALTADGQAVILRVLLPAFDVGADAIAAPIERLAAVFKGRGPLPRLPFDELLTQFRLLELAPQLDLTRQAEELDRLRRHCAEIEGLVVPRSVGSMSTRKLWVRHAQRSLPVRQLAGSLSAVAAEHLGRRLALIWLQQALVAGHFPVSAELEELEDGRIVVTGGIFASLPEHSRKGLWDYLRATSEHYPDRAFGYLRAELEPLRQPAPDIELRTRMRQAVPFRDGGWTKTGESVAEYAMQHWRWSRASGFRVPGHLTAFFRGMFWLANEGRRLSRDDDPLGEGLEGLAWMAGWNQLRQASLPANAARTAEGYGQQLLELPQKLDRILDHAERGDFEIPRTQPASRNKEGSAVTLALLLGMLAVWLLARSPAAVAIGWLQPVAVGLFIVQALLFLGVILRRR